MFIYFYSSESFAKTCVVLLRTKIKFPQNTHIFLFHFISFSICCLISHPADDRYAICSTFILEKTIEWAGPVFFSSHHELNNWVNLNNAWEIDWLNISFEVVMMKFGKPFHRSQIEVQNSPFFGSIVQTIKLDSSRSRIRISSSHSRIA